jgi:hypothetical protein
LAFRWKTLIAELWQSTLLSTATPCIAPDRPKANHQGPGSHALIVLLKLITSGTTLGKYDIDANNDIATGHRRLATQELIALLQVIVFGVAVMCIILNKS